MRAPEGVGQRRPYDWNYGRSDRNSSPLSSRNMTQENDRLRSFAYVLVALAALLTGVVLGQLIGPPERGSRADWPEPAMPRPRKIF